jgi:hypothetical protein
VERINCCIQRLSEIEESIPFWREPTSTELENDIHGIYEDIKFSEEEGSNVIKKWSDKFLERLLELFKEYISKGYDLMVINIGLNMKEDAKQDIAQFIASTYVKGNLSVKSSSTIDVDWLIDWSCSKAILVVKKLEFDLHYRIMNELLDEEKPNA